MLFESHLAFEIGEDAFDYQPGRGERTFAVEVVGGACLVGGEQADTVGGESLAVAAAPEKPLSPPPGSNYRTPLEVHQTWEDLQKTAA